MGCDSFVTFKPWKEGKCRKCQILLCRHSPCVRYPRTSSTTRVGPGTIEPPTSPLQGPTESGDKVVTFLGPLCEVRPKLGENLDKGQQRVP